MDRFDDEIERMAYDVIGAAIEVHRVLGPGHPEKVYGNALGIEIKAVEAIAQAHRGRTANYITYLKEPLGLLINFNVLQLKNGGINRIVQSMFKR